VPPPPWLASNGRLSRSQLVVQQWTSPVVDEAPTYPSSGDVPSILLPAGEGCAPLEVTTSPQSVFGRGQVELADGLPPHVARVARLSNDCAAHFIAYACGTLPGSRATLFVSFVRAIEGWGVPPVARSMTAEEAKEQNDLALGLGLGSLRGPLALVPSK
jgi:hypothetical protein